MKGWLKMVGLKASNANGTWFLGVIEDELTWLDNFWFALLFTDNDVAMSFFAREQAKQENGHLIAMDSITTTDAATEELNANSISRNGVFS